MPSSDPSRNKARRSRALRFLSGKCQGSEYIIEAESDVVIGRTSDAELVLLEGMVSRRHARLSLLGDVLSIEDLGSTNGTFVNGERITRRDLREGDRILIGTCILKVKVLVDGAERSPPPAYDEEAARSQDDTTVNHMTGSLEEISVPELIELVGQTRDDATIEVESAEGVGVVIVRDMVVESASLLSLPAAPSQKAIQRILGWERGSFVVRAYTPPGRSRLDVAIPELIVDGMYRVDELTVLGRKLPAPDARISLPRPLLVSLRALDDGDLELLQHAHNAGTVAGTLDLSLDTDLEAAERLLRLLESGYLRAH